MLFVSFSPHYHVSTFINGTTASRRMFIKRDERWRWRKCLRSPARRPPRTKLLFDFSHESSVLSYAAARYAQQEPRTSTLSLANAFSSRHAMPCAMPTVLFEQMNAAHATRDIYIEREWNWATRIGREGEWGISHLVLLVLLPPRQPHTYVWRSSHYGDIENPWSSEGEKRHTYMPCHCHCHGGYAVSICSCSCLH